MPPGCPPTAPETTPGSTVRYEVKLRLVVGRSTSSRVSTKPPTSFAVVSTSGASAVTDDLLGQAADIERDVHDDRLADLEPQIVALILVKAGQFGLDVIDARQSTR